ncbi:MAG: hypothetical protein J6P13_01570 [Kiritimatiellae bacterium]|nr:hypothetical protein [Kiritimatiellia bacterium]
MDTSRTRSRGQAMVELAFGMLALALVMSAVFGFAAYIVKSLDMQRELRAEAGEKAMGSSGLAGSYSSASDSDKVEVEPFATQYVFGSEEVKVSEEVHLPNMKGTRYE